MVGGGFRQERASKKSKRACLIFICKLPYPHGFPPRFSSSARAFMACYLKHMRLPFIHRKRKNLPAYFAHNLFNILAIVLIWRGLWYLLDYIDRVVFNGGHFVTVVLGIVAGFAILYLPDKSLNELEKL